MREVHNRKIYDTAKAKELAYYWDIGGYCRTLYRTNSTGVYFILCSNPRGFWSRLFNHPLQEIGIDTITEEGAYAWMDRHASAEAVERAFPDIVEEA